MSLGFEALEKEANSESRPLRDSSKIKIKIAWHKLFRFMLQETAGGIKLTFEKAKASKAAVPYAHLLGNRSPIELNGIFFPTSMFGIGLRMYEMDMEKINKCMQWEHMLI